MNSQILKKQIKDKISKNSKKCIKYKSDIELYKLCIYLDEYYKSMLNSINCIIKVELELNKNKKK